MTNTDRRNAARHARAVVAVTVLVDLVMVTLAYAVTRAERLNRLPDLALLAKVNPVILATIPCWVLVFFAFGLYSRNQVLKPSLQLPRLLGATTMSIFVIVLVAFAFSLALHRSWLAILLIVSTLLVVLGRLVILGLAKQLHEVR